MNPCAWERRAAVVIEDDLDIRNLLCAVLEQSGFQACGAATGREGVDAVRQEHPAVVTLDRQRTGDALAGKVVHQTEEEGQVVGVDALLVEGQDVEAAIGFDAVVGVLDAFGDPFGRQ